MSLNIFSSLNNLLDLYLIDIEMKIVPKSFS